VIEKLEVDWVQLSAEPSAGRNGRHLRAITNGLASVEVEGSAEVCIKHLIRSHRVQRKHVPPLRETAGVLHAVVVTATGAVRAAGPKQTGLLGDGRDQ